MLKIFAPIFMSHYWKSNTCLKYQKENVFVFGDSGNDVSMIKRFKNSIAMGNGINEVKKHAKYITKSVDEAGVVYALKELLKVI